MRMKGAEVLSKADERWTQTSGHGAGAQRLSLGLVARRTFEEFAHGSRQSQMTFNRVEIGLNLPKVNSQSCIIAPHHFARFGASIWHDKQEHLGNSMSGLYQKASTGF
jgi:hypothetical protein